MSYSLLLFMPSKLSFAFILKVLVIGITGWLSTELWNWPRVKLLLMCGVFDFKCYPIFSLVGSIFVMLM